MGEDRRNRGNRYKEARKCCLVDRDHFRPVVPAERNPVAWQPQPQNITSAERWLSAGWRDDTRVRGGLGGREEGLNGYILISFVHPQKLPSVPFRRSRQLVLGLVSFRKEATLCRTQTFANTFVPKPRALIRRGT